MSEQEPGLFITDMAPVGTVYLMDLGAVRPFEPGGTQRGVVIHPKDWDRLSPSEQERVRDLMVRHSAQDGFRALETFLARNGSSAR